MDEQSYFQQQTEVLQKVLDMHSDKRVCVVGTTCTGKSYFVKHLHGALDMDELIFPLLSKDEQGYICQKPWTPHIGQAMTRFVRERVKIEAGKPVFGMVVIDSDILIYLWISEHLLQQRVAFRGKNYEDARNMQQQIETEVKRSGLRCIEFIVG